MSEGAGRSRVYLSQQGTSTCPGSCLHSAQCGRKKGRLHGCPDAFIITNLSSSPKMYVCSRGKGGKEVCFIYLKVTGVLR